MARTRRMKSESGYYHVILRGVNKQDIFFDEEDFERMIDTLRRYQRDTDILISAYCLMNNHIHLLVNVKDGLDIFVKKIASSYVYYFNCKYERVGHLFQERYRSEAIETNDYLLTVFRYILQNPLKAGICPPETYSWNSWDSLENPQDFCDIEQIVSIAGSRKALKEYVLEKNNDQCLEADSSHKLSESEALQEAMRITGGENPLQVALYPKDKRNTLIAQMKKAGLSIRQISRLTGINRNIVQRA